MRATVTPAAWRLSKSAPDSLFPSHSLFVCELRDGHTSPCGGGHGAVRVSVTKIQELRPNLSNGQDIRQPPPFHAPGSRDEVRLLLKGEAKAVRSYSHTAAGTGDLQMQAGASVSRELLVGCRPFEIAERAKCPRREQVQCKRENHQGYLEPKDLDLCDI